MTKVSSLRKVFGRRFRRKCPRPQHHGKPMVSVITTVFNRATVIEKAICSVMHQTYRNIEYVVVDAASTDGTQDVLLKYSDIIDVVVSEPDGGLYEGMNKGLHLAEGDYIIFLNSDDWYFPHCIEKLVNEVNAWKCDFACGLAVEADEYGQKIRDIPMLPFGDNVRLRMPLRHETMLVSKELYKTAGEYDVHYKIIADLKMAQRFYELGASCRQIPEYLMSFRKMGVASVLSESFIDERRRLLAEQFNYLTTDELDLLANEYKGDPTLYLNLAIKYEFDVKLVRSLKAFLNLHSVFRKPDTNKRLAFFDKY